MKRYLQSVEEFSKALEEGKRIFDKGNIDGYIEMVKGFICYFYKNKISSMNVAICIEDDRFYTEEPEPLKFEVNKLYKTSKK